LLFSRKPLHRLLSTGCYFSQASVTTHSNFINIKDIQSLITKAQQIGQNLAKFLTTVMNVAGFWPTISACKIKILKNADLRRTT